MENFSSWDWIGLLCRQRYLLICLDLGLNISAWNSLTFQGLHWSQKNLKNSWSNLKNVHALEIAMVKKDPDRQTSAWNKILAFASYCQNTEILLYLCSVSYHYLIFCHNIYQFHLSTKIRKGSWLCCAFSQKVTGVSSSDRRIWGQRYNLEAALTDQVEEQEYDTVSFPVKKSYECGKLKPSCERDKSAKKHFIVLPSASPGSAFVSQPCKDDSWRLFLLVHPVFLPEFWEHFHYSEVFSSRNQIGVEAYVIRERVQESVKSRMTVPMVIPSHLPTV